MTKLEKQEEMRERQARKRRGRPVNEIPQTPWRLVVEGRTRLKCYLLWMAGKSPRYLSVVMSKELGRTITVEAVNLWIKLGCSLRPISQVLADRGSVQLPSPPTPCSGKDDSELVDRI
jgi:hypothetical protein